LGVLKSIEIEQLLHSEVVQEGGEGLWTSKLVT